MKLSEALAKLGIKVDELEDDEIGISLPELRKRYQENQKSFTQATQKLSELERAMKEKERQLLEAQQVLQQWNDWYRTYGSAYNTTEEVSGDPEIQQLRDLINQLREEQRRLSEQWNAQWNAAVAWANAQEVRRLKAQYPDFDEAAVREYAVKHNIPTWEAAYEGWKGSKADELIAKAKEEAQAEVAKKMESAPPPVERGEGTPIEIETSKPKEYKAAWGDLVGEIQRLGIV